MKTANEPMDCLIITNESGISFQFNDLVRDGEIMIKFEGSGLEYIYSFKNTDFLRLPASLFENKGNAEVKVFSGHAIIKKKKLLINLNNNNNEKTKPI